jgi:hypothetical protein
MPIFIACATFVILLAFWPSPKDLGRLIALSAAVLLGVQFWYADRGGVYVLWYLPLVLLMVLRPNLSDRYPPLPSDDSNEFDRLGRRVVGWFRRVAMTSPKEPVASRRPAPAGKNGPLSAFLPTRR